MYYMYVTICFAYAFIVVLLNVPCFTDWDLAKEKQTDTRNETLHPIYLTVTLMVANTRQRAC